MTIARHAPFVKVIGDRQGNDLRRRICTCIHNLLLIADPERTGTAVELRSAVTHGKARGAIVLRIDPVIAGLEQAHGGARRVYLNVLVRLELEYVDAERAPVKLKLCYPLVEVPD